MKTFHLLSQDGKCWAAFKGLPGCVIMPEEGRYLISFHERTQYEDHGTHGRDNRSCGVIAGSSALGRDEHVSEHRQVICSLTIGRIDARPG